MFIIREARESDVNDLYSLSLLANFLNLPQNKTLLSAKIQKSIESFKDLSQFSAEKSFLFVLEDISTKSIVGCSNLHAQHGTTEKPHYYLKVDKELKKSESLNLEFSHETLKLGIEVNGYTEIGGLVLNPNFRGHALKLGKQVSFSRFLFISTYPHLFTDQIHTELLPPFDENGSSPLWEGLGEKFFKMNYLEADIISRKDKRFILDLFPKDTIYTHLLEKSAREAIGKVSKNTIAGQKMLERQGFVYTGEIDPFDGGPHYRCAKDQIKSIKDSQELRVSFKEALTDQDRIFLISPMNTEVFESFCVKGSIEEGYLKIQKQGHLKICSNSKYKVTAL